MPAIPYRSNGKLTFPLCRTCVETYNQKPCRHSATERTLERTWCLPELVEALNLGYTIVRLIEVWHFPNSEERLFAEYIEKFLKLKAEVSGWPSNMKTEAKKQQFLQDFEMREGVKLEPENMQKTTACGRWLNCV